MHIALQGCLRARDVPYGITPDTGGHIRYLLDLVAAAERCDPDLTQQIIVRRFDSKRLGAAFGERSERISAQSGIVRIDGASPDYVAKEDLRFELPVLANALEAHIRTLPRLPDVLHGHFCDGGMLAVEMKRRFGIPVVFTAHSLGRVKALTLGADNLSGALKDRIEIEEKVIAQADRIVASSMDEAELQYGTYRATRPERIRLNPPGCDLGVIRSGNGKKEGGIVSNARFLRDPSKPPVLALARPVRKKNLAGLVRAFGQNERLRDRANLVIYAGTRTSIADEDDETREVFSELLTLIDDFDLWGQVAFPKTHRPQDVPAIYRECARRGGVFANVALNEPFGLTFLEAAAAGLPVVATNKGGPNDILGRCRNGTLVDPDDTDAIGAAILALLEDRDLWHAASRNGLDACGYYSWDRHASDYVSDLARIASRPARPRRTQRPVRRILVCDIDGTLTGDGPALRRLETWLDAEPDTAFGIATGRSLHSALDIMRQWRVPVPRFLITSVGSEIYWVHDDSFCDLEREPGWPRAGLGAWEPGAIEARLNGLPGVTRQAVREQRPFKRSYFLDDSRRCATLRRLLDAEGLDCEMVYSHGRFLDILPRGVSKGHAIHHLGAKLGVAPRDIYAAGDSGNDAHMLEMVGKPIIVGNHTGELSHLRQSADSYFARSDYAAGVLEGLAHHFRPASHDVG